MLSTDDLKEKVIYYVKKRKCNGGGFCFYRLEEPNGSDTYYAVSILNLLNIKFRDINTMNYLRDLQKEDGSYSSVFSAYYSIKTLNILKEKPIQDPKPYILENIRIYNTNRIPPGYTSIFREMYYLIDLCFTLKVELEEKIKNNLINFILKFKKGDGGFGYTHSTLIETSQALSILKWLEYPIKMLNAENFLKKCENSIYGFTNMPNITPSFIEHLHAGTITSNLLNYKPRYLKKCIEFIKECQNNNGGFARAALGISTLEDTYYAIHSLSLFSIFL